MLALQVTTTIKEPIEVAKAIQEAKVLRTTNPTLAKPSHS